MEKLEQTDADPHRGLELMQKHNALADTLDRARHHGAMARDALGLIADSPVKRAMVEAIDFAIERVH